MLIGIGEVHHIARQCCHIDLALAGLGLVRLKPVGPANHRRYANPKSTGSRFKRQSLCVSNFQHMLAEFYWIGHPYRYNQNYVCWLYYLTGEADFCLICLAPDMHEFEELTKRLFFGDTNVRRFRTSVVMGRKKIGLQVPIGDGG